MSRPQDAGGRRAPLPPVALRDEVVRARLVDLLAARFDVPITVLVAGAGFGKTTALAQALRANDATPRGIDVWVACEPGDEDAGRLATAIVAGLGANPVGRSDIDRVLAALGAVAPVDVCVVIDDAHELPEGSSGEALVRDLASQLPPHAHLILASRRALPIPLARRRAAAQVIEVDGDTLAFTDAELTTLAGLAGGDPTVCKDLAGWPSLVRLVLGAPHGSTRQFLWEEIVAGLTLPERAGLLALAVLGTGRNEEVALVAGRDVDLAHLLETVPLLHEDAEGTFGAHQLWEDAAERIFSVEEVRDAHGRALQVLHDRGDTVRMGSAAARWGDAAMLRRATIALVRENLGVLPTETAARWLRSTPPASENTPEIRLLQLALREAQQRHQDGTDQELDELAASFAATGEDDARAVVLAVAVVSSHSRGDFGRLLELTERIRVLPGVLDKPELRFFVDAVDAALASLTGDVEGTLRIITAMSFEGVPEILSEIIIRLHSTMLVLAGRAEEAVPIAETLLDSPHVYVRSVPAMVRWLAGDPSDYLAASPAQPAVPDDSFLYRFVATSHAAGVASSLGDRATVERVRPELEAAVAHDLDARESAIATVGLASCMLLEHDEMGATAAVDAHLTRYSLDDPRGETRLRRNLPIAYATSARAGLLERC